MTKNTEKFTEKKQNILANAIKIQDLLTSELKYKSISKQIQRKFNDSYKLLVNNKYSLKKEFHFLFIYEEAVLVVK